MLFYVYFVYKDNKRPATKEINDKMGPGSVNKYAE